MAMSENGLWVNPIMSDPITATVVSSKDKWTGAQSSFWTAGKPAVSSYLTSLTPFLDSIPPPISLAERLYFYEKVNGQVQNLEMFPGSSPKVVVAGSAAICPEKAQDIDIWILGGHMPKSVEETDFFPIATDPPEPINLTSYATQLANQVCCAATFKAAASEGGWLRKIQVFHFASWAAMNVEKLLGQFDLSCHAWAWSPGAGYQGLPQSTLPMLEPVEFLHPEQPPSPYQEARRWKMIARYAQ